ncbi:MAG: metallophosphoesterase family protein [Candidatus Micrarchaeota archaeon]|nr:metallophosphoesterase family protein [Candidatus Micrarchaeota archaeon]
MKDFAISKNVILTPYLAVVLKDIKTGVIADLHIGMEETSMISTRLQTVEMTRKTRELIVKHKLERIVLNGDLKYSFGKRTRQEWDELANYAEDIQKLAEVVAIKGNHDFYIQNMLKGAEVKELFKIKKYRITHGNLDLKPEKNILTIIGNEHPMIKMRDEVGAKFEASVFVHCKKENVLVLPAFNPLSRGANILNEGEWLSPILSKCDMGSSEIYAIADDEVVELGKLKKLSRLVG